MVKIAKFDPVFSVRRDDYAILKTVNSMYNSMLSGPEAVFYGSLGGCRQNG
jgi:hypothetical protein